MFTFSVNNGERGGEKGTEIQEPSIENNLKFANRFLFVLGVTGIIVFWYMMWHYYVIKTFFNIPFLIYFFMTVFLWESSVSIVVNVIKEWKMKLY